jgi:hypothetical protein
MHDPRVDLAAAQPGLVAQKTGQPDGYPVSETFAVIRRNDAGNDPPCGW